MHIRKPKESNPLEGDAKDILAKFRQGCDLSDDSVILVGNGRSPLGKNLGRFIDSFNVIVRFNSVDVKAHKHDLGGRYGHYILATPQVFDYDTICNAPWESVFYHAWDFREITEAGPSEKCLEKFPDAVCDPELHKEIMHKFLPLGNFDVPNIKEGRTCKNYSPSTGFLSIFRYLKKYKKVHIYGFDWWDIAPDKLATENHHYKADSQTIGSLHHPLVEYSILKLFVDAGVVVDLNPDSKFYTEGKVLKHREWKQENQPFELKYHEGHNMGDNDALWNEQWSHIFTSFGLSPDRFPGGRLLDVGCGSRPALLYFNSGPQYYSDPLLDDYQRIERRKPQWDSIPIERKHSFPGEQKIDQLVGKCDFVMSWNALDHGYDWRSAVKNCISYLKDDGLFLLGTDCTPHKYHIGIDDEKELREIISDSCDIVSDLSKPLGGLSQGEPTKPWERAVMLLCKPKADNASWVEAERKKYNALYSNGYPGGSPTYLLSGLDIPKQKKWSVIDLGCGHGGVCGVYDDYTGVDVSDKVLELNKKRFGSRPATWVQGSLHDLSLFRSKKYDLAVCADVMEHIPEEEVESCLKEIATLNSAVFAFGISTRLAAIKGVNGEQLHLTVKPKEWWVEVLSKYFTVVKVVSYETHPDKCGRRELVYIEASNLK